MAKHSTKKLVAISVFVKRLKAEATDVLESIPYLETLSNVDKN
jgi:hypothetical protein